MKTVCTLADQLKIRLSGEAMPLHFVCLAIDFYFVIETSADHRKKDRGMPWPNRRVCLPKVLDVAFLVKKGGKLSSEVTDRDPDVAILYCTHWTKISRS